MAVAESKHTRTTVARIPNCDLCDGREVPAYADAKLGPGMPWANVCKKHFDTYGCKLGLGLGQELVLAG
jgi:hypothetical protein